LLDKNGKEKGEVEVREEVFSYPVKEHLLYESVVNYMANKRRGTASTKTRGEVSGGGRKPWRQKGTGRARAGSIRSPLWRKGGTVFGPKPRDYSYRLPKKERRNALKSALALKFSEDRLLIFESLDFASPKTKEAAKLLNELKLDSALVVENHQNRNLFLSLRNLPRVKAIDQSQLSPYDILNHDWLVFTKKSFESLLERLR